MARERVEGFSSIHGRIQIEPIEDGQIMPLRADGTIPSIGHSRYTWRPAQEIEDQLPSELAIAFDCITRGDERHFIPVGGAAALIPKASLAGCALLAKQHNLSPQQLFSYRAMRLLHQNAPGLKEHLDRTFNRLSDLFIPKAGQSATSDNHILPPSLGLDDRGQGTAWTPHNVLVEGRSAAIAKGQANPDQATCIRYGLLAAARANPLDVTTVNESEALALMRMALFDIDDTADPVEESVINTVQERLWGAVERHIGDERADFNHWFFEGFNDIIHAIAKQKKAGGPILRETVRRAILELTVRSYTYVGDSVHVFMQAFARSLPEPLTPNERIQFGMLYLKRNYLGGWPFVLINERFDFLKEAILEVWDEPSDIRRMGTLLRLLSYYGELVGEKRKADREYKRRSGRRNENSGVAQILSFDSDSERPLEPDDSCFQRLVMLALGNQNRTCLCGTRDDWKVLLQTDHDTADPVDIEYSCDICGHCETIAITLRELKEAKKALFPDTGG